MRLYELNAMANSNEFSFSLLDGLSTHDEKTLRVMITDVDQSIAALTTELIQHLHQLKHSSNYVNILVKKFQQKLISVEKFKATREVLKQKIIDLGIENESLQPKLDSMIIKTKLLQTQIEKDISKRYKNRVVNLMGVII